MARVDSLTAQGLGRIAEGDTPLPRVLPGEEVEIVEDGGVRILTPSPDRVSPPCAHFKRCGGCAMQHASDAFVAQWKQNVIVAALQAQGMSTEIRPIITSPAQTRRRAKLTGRRTKKGALVGFHARASHDLIAVPDCLLLTPALMAAMPAFAALTDCAATRKSTVALTVTESAAGVDVLVETDKPLTADLRVTLAALANAHRLARLVWNTEPVVTPAPPMQDFAGVAVLPPPGAFLQATKAGEQALQQSVAEIVAGASRIIDLFAGCGTFALPLAQSARVHAVEGAAQMLGSLDAGWRGGAGLRQVTTETRDLFRNPVLAEDLRPYQAAVIDPPRAGASAQVAEIAASELAVVAMVSCNPVSFARDAAKLTAAGFRLDWVQPVDQFRWASHVELVAAFTR